MRRNAFFFATCAALLGGSATAAAPAASLPGSSYAIEIKGFVPVICRASVDASIVPAADGESPLGELHEFCNSPSGYQVFVDSSPELAGATLILDGRAVTLSDEGSTLLASSDKPAIVSRGLSLSADAPTGGSLSFRIVPL